MTYRRPRRLLPECSAENLKISHRSSRSLGKKPERMSGKALLKSPMGRLQKQHCHTPLPPLARAHGWQKVSLQCYKSSRPSLENKRSRRYLRLTPILFGLRQRSPRSFWADIIRIQNFKQLEATASFWCGIAH